MRLRDFSLEAEFNLENRLSKKVHPKKIVINLLGRSYKFEFDTRVERDSNTILRSFAYSQAKLLDETASTFFDVVGNNQFVLGKDIYMFSELKRILSMRGIVKCAVLDDYMNCNLR